MYLDGNFISNDPEVLFSASYIFGPGFASYAINHPQAVSIVGLCMPPSTCWLLHKNGSVVSFFLSSSCEWEFL